MFKTKFDGNELEVLIDEAVQKSCSQKGSVRLKFVGW